MNELPTTGYLCCSCYSRFQAPITGGKRRECPHCGSTDTYMNSEMDGPGPDQEVRG